MKVVYATYIDHQEDIHYPIAYLKHKCPELHVFCADQRQQDILSESGIASEILGIGIIVGTDIPIVQNECIDRVFKTENADFVIWQQADIYI